MLTVSDLRTANPSRWKAAADGWLKLAKESERAADDIYDRHAKKLTKDWALGFGPEAAELMRDLANDFRVAGAAIRGAVAILDGLAESMEILQRELHETVEYAGRSNLAVTDTWGVTGEPSTPGANTTVLDLLQATRDSANEIDEKAAEQLDRLATATSDHSISHVQSEFQEDKAGGYSQLDLLKASLPRHLTDPSEVTRWWNSLTPEGQRDLKRAVPVDLYDLNGIPDDVKKELTGPGPIDRIKMLRFAQDHVNDSAIDVLHPDNCANFTSRALAAGGMPYTGAFNWVGIPARWTIKASQAAVHGRQPGAAPRRNTTISAGRVAPWSRIRRCSPATSCTGTRTRRAARPTIPQWSPA
jgi:hypothetical protein